MGLRIVYGRAGSGKSSFCYNEIREKVSGADSTETGLPKLCSDSFLKQSRSG